MVSSYFYSSSGLLLTTKDNISLERNPITSMCVYYAVFACKTPSSDTDLRAIYAIRFNFGWANTIRHNIGRLRSISYRLGEIPPSKMIQKQIV